MTVAYRMTKADKLTPIVRIVTKGAPELVANMCSKMVDENLLTKDFMVEEYLDEVDYMCKKDGGLKPILYAYKDMSVEEFY